MINIFIIDDSVLFRTKMTKDIELNENLKVIGTANDVDIAIKRLKIFKTLPDIIILDVEMPKVDGLTFLEEYLSQLDTNVIVCTSYYEKYKQKASRLGAFAVLDKQVIFNNNSTILISEINKLNHIKKFNHTDSKTQKISKRNTLNNSKVIAIGASTGGLNILENILLSLPSEIPPILIVQHMGRDIIPTFIPKIEKHSNIKIKQAKHNDKIEKNTVYIAPFNKHLMVAKDTNGGIKIVISNGDKVSYHRPSIDLLFTSLAESVKQNAAAFILTGMGYDGVNGIKAIKQNGGKTFAQDEQSSQVFGMPKAAIESKVIDRIISDKDIVFEILSL